MDENPYRSPLSDLQPQERPRSAGRRPTLLTVVIAFVVSALMLIDAFIDWKHGLVPLASLACGLFWGAWGSAMLIRRIGTEPIS